MADRILITGATGFIGYHLITRLRQEGRQVRALVLPSDEQASALSGLGVEVAYGDVCDYPSVERAAANCQVIFHLAKREGVGYSRQHIIAVNAQGTLHVGRAALHAGATRLVSASSGAVYGRAVRYQLITEKTSPRPDTVYAKSKLLAEEMLLDLHRRHGLAVVIPRISQVLGPRALSWLNLFQTIAAGRYRLIGSGQGYHHVVDVADVVDGLMRCADVDAAGGQLFVLAGPEPVRLRHLIGLISETVGARHSGKSLPAGPYRLYGMCSDALSAWTGMALPRADRIDFCFRDRAFDISRSRRELGYTPRISAKEAVQCTAEWFKGQGYLA